MKLLSAIATFFTCLVAVQALTTPAASRVRTKTSATVSTTKPSHQKILHPSNQSVQSLAVSLALSLAIVLPVNALDNPSVFNNDYADPFHPFCERHIKVASDGKTFQYTGTAVGPKGDTVLRGCSAEEKKQYGLRQGAFEGKILSDNRITAGDGIHEGVWEPAKSATTNLGYEDVDGIRWDDGNKWVVKDQSIVRKVDNKWKVLSKGVPTKVAEYIFYAYIGFSTLAGLKGLVDGIQRKRQSV